MRYYYRYQRFVEGIVAETKELKNVSAVDARLAANTHAHSLNGLRAKLSTVQLQRRPMGWPAEEWTPVVTLKQNSSGKVVKV